MNLLVGLTVNKIEELLKTGEKIQAIKRVEDISGMAKIMLIFEKYTKRVFGNQKWMLQRIMKTYAMAQLVSWPLVMISGWFLHVNKTLFRFVEPFVVRYLIITLRFFYSTFRGYIGFNSLIIAICRYTFVLYDRQVYNIGFKRVAYLYLISSAVIPIFFSFLSEATHPLEDFWICMFMPQDNRTQEEQSNETRGILCDQNTIQDVTESPIYNLFKDHLPSSFTYGMWICVKIFLVINNSNIIEGIMYAHIFLDMNRYP